MLDKRLWNLEFSSTAKVAVGPSSVVRTADSTTTKRVEHHHAMYLGLGREAGIRRREDVSGNTTLPSSTPRELDEMKLNS